MPSPLLFSEARTNSETSRNESILGNDNHKPVKSHNSYSFFLTCRGCIPEAMRSLIILTWARFFGSSGSSRGPGLVSSMYWITASCVSKSLFLTVFCLFSCGCVHRWRTVGYLTDWHRVMPSIFTAGTCCMGFNVLYSSVSLNTEENTYACFL